MFKRFIGKIKSLFSRSKVGASVKDSLTVQASETMPMQVDVSKPKPPSVREMSKEGIDLVKSFEGLYLHAYKCPANVTTIGYGTTIYPNGNDIQMGDTCTKEEAEAYLQYDLLAERSTVETTARKCKLLLNDNQFSALVSLAYNVGSAVITQSSRSTGSALLSKDYDRIADSFLVYNKARNKYGFLVELNGLTRRRKAERALFLS